MGKILDRKDKNRIDVNWKRQVSNKRKFKYSVTLNIVLLIVIIGVLINVI